MMQDFSQSVQNEKNDNHELESSRISSWNDKVGVRPDSIPTLISLTKSHMEHLNRRMESMHPREILRFCMTLFPNLYQSTAFGLTGLATLDMLSKIQAESPNNDTVDLVFLDTLYHFNETYELVDRVKNRYPNVPIHIFKPKGVDSVKELEEVYGEELYHTASDKYDYIVKVEPLERAYDTLNIAAILNGRRRSQGAARGSIPIIELDEERHIFKINPLATWTFSQVNDYIKENNVPYNHLLDIGYKSVGDWHSTSPIKDGDDERAGRWAGQAKTECGIHNKKSRYAQFLRDVKAS
ncbi:hypothetical protein NQ176_g2992 [Zarea fungicola]|uniref:Uncharacterized protein n=1 Tax=Zarea fungicola TaxID=93591 RepID=A0ACC1NLS1_9HYPO|nr:hypothetical protein NQ176_g2992 [Lecanicillium fungicola]